MSQFSNENELVNLLVKQGWLKTPRVIGAFRKIKRKDFLPEDTKDLYELNQALPIGFGQTISQPLTVAFMLELLQPKKGDKILDVGAGSGWTAALLAEITGSKGKVIAIEVIKELKEFGEKNVAKYGFIGKQIIEFVLGDGSLGFLPAGRQVKKNSQNVEIYDKILVSASAKKEPEALKEQLKINGRLVCPIENSIWLFIKKNENKLEKTEYKGFVFVPLV